MGIFIRGFKRHASGLRREEEVEVEINEDGSPNGGSIADPAHAWYSSYATPTSVDPNTSTPLPFVYQSGYGANLLDLTDPTTPTILEDGVYCICVEPGFQTQSGKVTQAVLLVDLDTFDDGPGQDVVGSGGSLIVSMTQVWNFTAGMKIQVTVNHDSDAAKDFTLWATVTKIR